jgi:hypothetical protein
MRFGNEPLACPVVARFSSFMVVSCFREPLRASNRHASNFNRVRPSSMMSPSASWRPGQPLAVDAHAVAVRAGQIVITNSSSGVCSITA